MALITLDSVAHLAVEEDELRRRGNEVRSLAYLWEGLEFISRQVEQIETVAEPVVSERRFGGVRRNLERGTRHGLCRVVERCHEKLLVLPGQTGRRPLPVRSGSGMLQLDTRADSFTNASRLL